MKHTILLALQVSIIATVFAFGLNTTVARLAALLRQPGLIARSIFSMFVVMPLVAIALIRWFDLPATVDVVLLALSVSPVPPLLPRREGKSGGDVYVGVGLMAILAVASLAAVPAIVAILQRVFGGEFTLPVAAMTGLVLKTVLVPLAAGMGLRAAAPEFAARLETLATTVAKVLLPVAALLLMIGSASAIWDAVGMASVFGLSVFVVAGLTVGHVLGGPEPDQSVVLALSTACRHPAIALTIAATNAPHQPIGGTVILYLFLNLLLAIPYVRWLKATARLHGATPAYRGRGA